MITTNNTRTRVKEDDGNRRVVTTSSMKPSVPRAVPHEFPGVNKRETNKVDPKVKFNTTELDHLVNGMGYKRAAKAEPVLAPAIKTPQPKTAKKVAARKRKAG